MLIITKKFIPQKNVFKLFFYTLKVLLYLPEFSLSELLIDVEQHIVARSKHKTPKKRKDEKDELWKSEVML